MIPRTNTDVIKEVKLKLYFLFHKHYFNFIVVAADFCKFTLFFVAEAELGFAVHHLQEAVINKWN